MDQKSQLSRRVGLILLAIFCIIPSLAEGYAILWGQRHGLTGKALRDGLDFWAGGFLALHGHAAIVFNPAAYQSFLNGAFFPAAKSLTVHIWSYPPNYLLLAAAFGWLTPWHAVLAFDALSLALLVLVLRLAKLPRLLILAVAASPVSFENFLAGQNGALLTALLAGGILLLPRRPLLAGVLAGLASIKPQLGLVLPLFLLRRSPLAFAWAAIAAVVLAAASLWAFGQAAWAAFWTVTRPAMSNVLLTGQPPEFAGGLISVFAAVRFLGVHPALAIQGAVSLAAILWAWRRANPVEVLILAALASPYLHDYDLLGVALAVALLVQDRLERGFLPGEAILFFLAWFGPGTLTWAPQFAHFAPLLLLLLLASAARRGPVMPCDSSQVPPVSPVSSAGRLPIPNPPNSTAPGLPATE
jgi:hypothetical protein